MPNLILQLHQGVCLEYFYHSFHTILTYKLQFSLYIHAGSPSVTGLTYNDQSRTLTCTSTGGPATTVTWTRDGVVITLNTTYKQTKRLVVSVRGTYQTVLTIDSSLDQSNIVGTYNCTMENDRGSSSETVVVTGETELLYLELVQNPAHYQW